MCNAAPSTRLSHFSFLLSPFHFSLFNLVVFHASAAIITSAHPSPILNGYPAEIGASSAIYRRPAPSTPSNRLGRASSDLGQWNGIRLDDRPIFHSIRLIQLIEFSNQRPQSSIDGDVLTRGISHKKKLPELRMDAAMAVVC